MAHKIISKADAKKAGLPRYFTGKPCAKGHIAEKYVNSDKCIECRNERNKLRKRGKTAKSKAVVPTTTGNATSASSWGGLTRRVNALIEKADKAFDKAEQFYKSAGLTIKEIKEKFPGNWEAIVQDECGIGRSCAYELMGIADGTTTLEKVRDRSNRSSKISHAKKSAVQGTAVESPVREAEDIEETLSEAEAAEIAELDRKLEAKLEAERVAYSFDLTADDEPTMAAKIVMVIGKERAALLVVELQKQLRAEAA